MPMISVQMLQVQNNLKVVLMPMAMVSKINWMLVLTKRVMQNSTVALILMVMVFLIKTMPAQQLLV